MHTGPQSEDDESRKKGLPCGQPAAAVEHLLLVGRRSSVANPSREVLEVGAALTSARLGRFSCFRERFGSSRASVTTVSGRRAEIRHADLGRPRGDGDARRRLSVGLGWSYAALKDGVSRRTTPTF